MSLLLVVGCRGDASSADTGRETTSSESTNGGDTSSSSGIDASDESSSSTGEIPPPEPPPVAPFAEPMPWAIPRWMVAPVDSGSDEVRAAIEADAFELPEPGEAYGTVWEALEPGPNGALVDASADYLYAAAELDVPADRFVFGRHDSVRAVFSNNGHEQPGDVYASGAIRVPLHSAAERDLVVVQAYGTRGVPQVELFTTPDELVLNLADLTLPQYPEGDASEQFVGVPVLNLTDQDTRHVRTHVLENEYFEDAVLEGPGLPAVSVTQLAFALRPKQAFASAGTTVPVRLRVEPLWFAHSYEREIEIEIVERHAVYRRTRRSAIDGSVQFYGVLPPAGEETPPNLGLILSLHGAGVGGDGQAAAYSAKDWAVLIAPTNRRPYGFDWEEWGRLDAMEALEHAQATFAADPTRIHVTGHSMGGHGTWHMGVHFPLRFGVVAPSAGWISFDTYSSLLIPEGVLGAAQAAGKTLDFAGNLAHNPVYIIHGLADDNVPSFQAQTMYETLDGVAPELWYHAEPDAGHWWDLDPKEPGADCVDWEPMIDVMEERFVESLPLTFHVVSAGPSVSPRHAYARLRSAITPLEHCELTSRVDDGVVSLRTVNVRSLDIDAAALRDAGALALEVDGERVDLTASDAIVIGPESGKTPEVYGPLNQIFHRPVLFVYPDAGPSEYREYAAFLAGWWAAIGNGQLQAIPFERLTAELRDAYNIVYLGVSADAIDDLPEAMQFDTREGDIVFGGQTFDRAALAFVYPAATGRLSAVWIAGQGNEALLFRYMPFSSRAGKPDYYIWRSNGIELGGFFTAEWTIDPSLASAF